MKPLVSINIPTYRSQQTLKECLLSVINQEYHNVEIIVIDSHSRDRTLEIAKKYGAKTYFADTLSEARKIGVEKSHGKYILFLDSDQILTSDIIEKCVNKCEKEGYDLVTLFEKSLIQRNTPIERAIAYDKWLFHSQRDNHPVYGSAIPRFFRTDILRKIKWPKSLGVQEHNIIYHRLMKVGSRVTFLNEYIYHHEPTTLSQFAKKFYRYGLSYVAALREDKKLVIFHSMPRRVYFSKRAFDKPDLLIVLILLYVVKALATLSGVIAYHFNKICKKPVCNEGERS